jgi:hypothetical protein
MHHSSETWITYNQQGLIPSPQEDEPSFLKRAHFCRNLIQELNIHTNAHLPFTLEDCAAKTILDKACLHSQLLYGISPSWVPVFFSNHQLALWHGGCAWIFQLDEQTPVAAFIQLRAHFRHSASYLGLYKRDELLTHEIAHIGRMMYDAPQFEEFFAYRSASSWLRRWFGPLVQSSTETLIFILVLGLTVMADLALLAFPASQTLSVMLGLKLIPLAFILFAMARLVVHHWQLHRCLIHLAQVYGDKTTALHVAYRLDDRSIRSFAKLSPFEIASFIETESTRSFYWRFIKTCYPLKSLHL